MSESSSDSSDDVFMRLYDMNDGLVALFETFMMRNEFAEALNFICDCPQISPTSFVINEIIFKIIMTCDSNLAYEALTYLEGALGRMPTDDLHNNVFIEGLKDRTGSFPDLWDAFSHFVLSVLHDRKILEGFGSSQEYVKSLNCDYLVEIYVKVFLKCSSNSPFFGYRPEENFTALMKWINVFYKHNVQMDEVLESLHLLLDHVIQCEISTRSAVPKCLAFQTAPLSQYILLILSNCKDVFVHSESLQRFFNNMESPLVILKICQRILDDLIGKESAHQNSVLTLKSIVEDYFFNQPRQNDPDPKQVSMSSPKKPSKKKNSKAARKSAKAPKSAKIKSGKRAAKIKSGKCPGDTKFHVCCRSNKFDDLLESLLFSDVSGDINLKNEVGNTPLHEACLAGSYYCCKFLIEESGARKLDFTATDNKGRTPLHLAVHKGAIDIVKLLLDRGGAELAKCCDNDGNKPFDYSKSEEVRDLLQCYELKLKPSDDESQASASCVQQIPSNLKNSQNFPIYLRTLRVLIANYCVAYAIPKEGTDVKILSHSDKECCHFKTSTEEMLCMDDSSTLENLGENIKKLAACAKCVSADLNIEGELRSLEVFAASFT